MILHHLQHEKCPTDGLHDEQQIIDEYYMYDDDYEKFYLLILMLHMQIMQILL
jgi:hypothetical protein